MKKILRVGLLPGGRAIESQDDGLVKRLCSFLSAQIFLND